MSKTVLQIAFFFFFLSELGLMKSKHTTVSPFMLNCESCVAEQADHADGGPGRDHLEEHQAEAGDGAEPKAG